MLLSRVTPMVPLLSQPKKHLSPTLYKIEYQIESPPFPS